MGIPWSPAHHHAGWWVVHVMETVRGGWAHAGVEPRTIGYAMGKAWPLAPWRSTLRHGVLLLLLLLLLPGWRMLLLLLLMPWRLLLLLLLLVLPGWRGRLLLLLLPRWERLLLLLPWGGLTLVHTPLGRRVRHVAKRLLLVRVEGWGPCWMVMGRPLPVACTRPWVQVRRGQALEEKGRAAV